MAGQPWMLSSNLIFVGSNRKNVSNLKPSEYRMLGSSTVTPASGLFLHFLKQPPEDEQVAPANPTVPKMGLSITDLS
ncbi:hypothetical protein FJ492_19930 [Mesorhizobium sp. B2-5-4]|uniref:hypothetical protein n=1 Tax=Mesorhizobium sp. B2-5-4 TaxID=2589926 RepID=UPI00116A2CD1|nr:hypothetical protein [Mesorhizobium sp. B2-5-4]TPK41274.1 hypothetical protein FJ492_19930 [Mesorhizobium sp. B2-5-4]